MENHRVVLLLDKCSSLQSNDAQASHYDATAFAVPSTESPTATYADPSQLEVCSELQLSTITYASNHAELQWELNNYLKYHGWKVRNTTNQETQGDGNHL